jgi:hypothetical protein
MPWLLPASILATLVSEILLAAASVEIQFEVVVEVDFEVGLEGDFASYFVFVCFDLGVVAFVAVVFCRLKIVGRIVIVRISKLETANWMNYSSEIFFEDIWSVFHILC